MRKTAHKTGRFRGLICRSCNMIISKFEDKEYVERVSAYLVEKGVV